MRRQRAEVRGVASADFVLVRGPTSRYGGVLAELDDVAGLVERPVPAEQNAGALGHTQFCRSSGVGDPDGDLVAATAHASACLLLDVAGRSELDAVGLQQRRRDVDQVTPE